jgi:hypothetical protein
VAHHDELTQALNVVVESAIAECVRAKASSGFPYPFVMLDGPSGKLFTEIVSNAADRMDLARGVVRKKAAGHERYVIAYDGVLTRKGGGTLDAFILECGERGQAQGLILFQRYARGEDGTIMLVPSASSLLRRSDQLLA